MRLARRCRPSSMALQRASRSSSSRAAPTSSAALRSGAWRRSAPAAPESRGLFVRFRRGAEGGVKIPSLSARADGGQLVGAEGEDRGAQHRDQRDVLMGVVQHGQQGQKRGDLHRAEEAAALPARHRDALPPSTRRYTPPTVLAERSRMAISPYSRGARPVLAVTVVPEAISRRIFRATKRGLQRRSCPGLSSLVPPPAQAQQQQLRLRDAALVPGRAEDQRGLIVIVHIAEGADMQRENTALAASRISRRERKFSRSRMRRGSPGAASHRQNARISR